METCIAKSYLSILVAISAANISLPLLILSFARCLRINFVYLSFSYCDELDSDTVYGLEQVQTLLGDRVEVIDTRQSTDRLLVAHKTIHEFQIYQNLYHYFDSNNLVSIKVECQFGTITSVSFVSLNLESTEIIKKSLWLMIFWRTFLG